MRGFPSAVPENRVVTQDPSPSTALSERTAWSRSVQTPLRRFLRTETGSAAILLAATLIALAWANLDASSYDGFWRTPLSIRLGDAGISQDVRGWINNGLMAFFFFVVGLEARREFDLGDLRERRRVALPLLAGIGGMAVPVAIYLAFTAGTDGARGWGTAMSTDTAFALGMLALLGPRLPDRVRAFILTVCVVDDLVALIVIAVAYSDHVSPGPLLVALAVFGVVLLLRAARVRLGPVYFALAATAWVALFRSGVEPLVIGLAMGLIAYAYPAARDDLERATDLFRLFREQPTPELARSAGAGLRTAISPNDRLQQLFHPWSSYLIVPLFALANAGLTIDSRFLTTAYTSPITLGIVIGYVAGKPLGIAGATWLAARSSGGRLRPPVGWAAVLGSGAIAGVGFTVSLLIATLAFEGAQLQQAKLGVLTAALCSLVLTWLVFRATALMPARRRDRALLGTAESIVDLAADVDPDVDHIRGPAGAPVTVVEYGDFQCPYCGVAEPVIRDLLAGFGDVRYVWRHLPLNDVHPQAQLAAEAAEAAAAQGAFWEMHDLLLNQQDRLRPPDLVAHAAQLGLDVDRFREFLHRRTGAARVAQDVDSADLSGVSGTPTFFVNGRRHHGAYDRAALTAAVNAAKARAALAP